VKKTWNAISFYLQELNRMGPKPSKVLCGNFNAPRVDAKLRQLELIVTGQERLVTSCSYLVFVLEEWCATALLTRDVAGLILHLSYSLSLTHCRSQPIDLSSYGFRVKEFKFDLATLSAAPIAIITQFPFEEQIIGKLRVKIRLVDHYIAKFLFLVVVKDLFHKKFYLDCLELLKLITKRSVDGVIEYDSAHVYDTWSGYKLHSLRTLVFVYDNIYMKSRAKSPSL
jgi:hypothetical protein